MFFFSPLQIHVSTALFIFIAIILPKTKKQNTRLKFLRNTKIHGIDASYLQIDMRIMSQHKQSIYIYIYMLILIHYFF